MVKYTVIASPGSGATFLIYQFLSKFYKDGLISMNYEKGIDESHVLFQELAEYSLIAHHNCTIVEKINKRYPEIKIIHLVRNGLDAVNSNISRNHSVIDAMNSFNLKKIHAEKDKYHIQLAKLWAYDIKEARKLIGNKNYLEIRYEDICAFPERELRKIEEFIKYSNKSALKYLKENLRPSIGKHKNLSKDILLEIQEALK